MRRGKKRNGVRARRAIDLFSGCGGLTDGLKQAGFSVVGAIEIGDLAAETYRLNHPEARLWPKDIRSVTVGAVKKALGLKLGDLELLAACPPCEGFSRIRTLNREAVADERNDLILEVLRFIRGLRPKTLMLENVPGLASDQRFSQFCEALTECGYSWRYKVLDAADYAVPQRRRRLILLAGCAGEIRFAPVARVSRTVRDLLEDLAVPCESDDEAHNFVEVRSPRIRRLISRIPKDGGSRCDLGRRAQLQCHKDCDGFYDVYGRMAWDEVSPTITGGCVNPSKGRFLHPEQDRAITPREAALLQSFRETYRFSNKRGKYAMAAMIGDALPPEFIRRHALQVRRYLDRPAAA